MEKAGIPTLYVYSGPQDAKGRQQRPFCQVLVGKAFTKKQIAALNNNQGLSVATHGGGYNCRHEWLSVPATYVKKAGIPRGTRKDIEKANKLAKRR